MTLRVDGSNHISGGSSLRLTERVVMDLEIPTLMVDVATELPAMLFSRNTFDPEKDIPSLENKVIIVTGGTIKPISISHDDNKLIQVLPTGNNGLGRETITQLAKHHPAAIYLCTRTLSRGEEALRTIRETVPDAPVKLLELDLASLSSVAAAATKFRSENSRLDILINNAGIMAIDGRTHDGYELQLGTNHLGHALLTKLLLPTMLKTAETESGADVRIVCLSSGAHTRAPAPGFDPQDRDLPKAGAMGRYSRSKLANVLFARQMAKQYPQITTVSIHPGVIRTNLFDQVMTDNGILNVLSRGFGFLVYKSVEDGAKNSLWAATAPKAKVESGAYYVPIGYKNGGSTYSRDDKLGQKLWQWTEEELKKQGY